MKKIKLFENFNPSSFEEVDDLLLSLQDKGILKIKHKPFFIIEESEIEDEDGYGIGTPQIVTRYYITKDLGKIDSIEKLETLENLLRDFRQAMSRIGTFGNYLIDLGAKEWEVKLPVPDNIKELTKHLGYPDDVGSEIRYIYDNDIDGYPFDVKLKFTVDEDLNILVEAKVKNTMSEIVTENEESLIQHFKDYGLDFTGIQERGKFKFYNFKNK